MGLLFSSLYPIKEKDRNRFINVEVIASTYNTSKKYRRIKARFWNPFKSFTVKRLCPSGHTLSSTIFDNRSTFMACYVVVIVACHERATTVAGLLRCSGQSLLNKLRGQSNIFRGHYTYTHTLSVYTCLHRYWHSSCYDCDICLPLQRASMLSYTSSIVGALDLLISRDVTAQCNHRHRELRSNVTGNTQAAPLALQMSIDELLCQLAISH